MFGHFLYVLSDLVLVLWSCWQIRLLALGGENSMQGVPLFLVPWCIRGVRELDARTIGYIRRSGALFIFGQFPDTAGQTLG